MDLFLIPNIPTVLERLTMNVYRFIGRATCDHVARYPGRDGVDILTVVEVQPLLSLFLGGRPECGVHQDVVRHVLQVHISCPYRDRASLTTAWPYRHQH